MKLKRENNRRKTGKGRIAAVLVLAVLLGAAPAVKTKAYPEGPFTIQISKSDETSDDITKASVVLDMYKVADAVTATDSNGNAYDAYTFGFVDPFNTTEVTEILNRIQTASETEGEKVSAEDVDALAQKLADIALTQKPPYTQQVSLTNAGTAAFNPSKGLYLILPHGSDLADYKYVSEDTSSTYVATIAEGDEKRFIFAPILLPVPNRGYQELSDQLMIDGNSEWTYPVGTGNTAQSAGEWDDPQKPIEVKLKVGEQDMNTKIRLDKELLKYETMEDRGDTATFAFTIDAYKNGNNVFSDARSVTLSAVDKSDYIEIDDIPVGSIVIIAEAYTGGDYTFDSVSAKTVGGGKVDPADPPEDIKVPANSFVFKASAALEENDIVLLSFKNTYDDKFKDGGSVTNHIQNNGGSVAGDRTYSDGKTKGVLGEDITDQPFEGEK